MIDYCKYVNVFQGVDEIDLPEPHGVAAAWKFIKGLCGNCTPAAALPFGRIQAGCYSSAYSSGYGKIKKNSHGPIAHLFENNKFKGIAHLQNDGTGDIDTFYNYAVVSPFMGELCDAATARDFDNERAFPGYYACRDSATGADCEVTVTRRAAIHRISCPHPHTRVSIDFSNDGLYDGGGTLHSPAGQASLTLIGDSEAEICAYLQRMPVYFYIKVSCAAGPLAIWADGKEMSDTSLRLEAGHTFGIVFDASDEVEIILGLSPKSAAIAKKDVLTNALSFDEAVKSARGEWNEAFSRVECEFEDERDYEIFYSNMYHTLTKPCDWSGESFLYDDNDFVLEFATIWDQYKTQFPLIFSLYPDLSKKIVNTILSTAEATQRMPHTLMMRGDFNELTTSQARMLAEYSIVDAYLRGVPFDVSKALDLCLKDTFEYGHFDEYAEKADEAKHKAFIIDITDACAACALMAREEGKTDIAERFENVAALWESVIDPESGLLKEGEKFYEGTRWNYSFRLMHDMDRRMEMAGGKEKFAALADRFFGFTDPENSSFEGFNNETDMESPYVYHFAGRHDRLSEVIDGSLKYMYTTGRGGLPGNNDTGGLSSCYMWNVIGIFPASGMDLMMAGSPRAKKTVMHLANGNTLTITRVGAGIYVKSLTLNGTELKDLSLTVRQMMQGGELRFEMSENA